MLLVMLLFKRWCYSLNDDVKVELTVGDKSYLVDYYCVTSCELVVCVCVATGTGACEQHREATGISQWSHDWSCPKGKVLTSLPHVMLKVTQNNRLNIWPIDPCYFLTFEV